MTQIGEAAYTPPTEPEDPVPDRKKISLFSGAYFDGTLNNRTNIEQRLVSVTDDKLTEEERKDAADLKKKMTPEDIAKAKGIYKKHEGVGSYENGFTNIVKLERNVDTDILPAGYDHMLKAYVEGPGTRDKKDDKFFGFVMGVGVSGVKNKVAQGLAAVVAGIKKEHRDKNTRIEKITIYALGFSRGAAAARSFIHEALLVETSIKQQLIDDGYQVGTVEVCFAGLFDTVSSHGLDFKNDTAALNLNAVYHAKDTVQLAAADEHRENFALTDVASAGPNGRQIYLPGVHSDVGGSYRDGASEDQDIFWTMSAQGEELTQQQIEELTAAGWFTKDELTVKRSTSEPGGKHTVQEVNLHAQRSAIRSHYSRIPLHLMAGFAREHKIAFKNGFDRREAVPPELSTAQQAIQQYVAEHGAKGSSSSVALHWHDNARAWLRQLRHDYFHFSARLTIGNGPRFNTAGKRQRYTIDG